MKLAIINDTHFGIRNDSPLFLENALLFFEEQFFPYLKEHGIKTVLHLGDFMDRRKYVNFNTLAKVRTRIVDRFKTEGIDLHIILGNHDTYFKNTNEINSLKELFADSFNVIEEPTILNLGGLDIAMIPWINSSNSEAYMDFIKTCKADILCGHLELFGYYAIRGVKHESGMRDDVFKRFEMVLSGHFHNRQSNGNIHYLGTQYQLTFNDLNDVKGFHILDTETRSLAFIENPNRMFYSIHYDDSIDLQTLSNLNYDKYANKFVRVYVKSKSNPYVFDKLLDGLYSAPVANITLIEDYEVGISDEVADMSLDTLSLINKEIDDLKDVEGKSELKEIMRELYMESLVL